LCGQEIEEDETLQLAVEALRTAKNEGALAQGGVGGGLVGGGEGKTVGSYSCAMEEALEPIVSAGQAIAEFDGVRFEYAVAPKLPLVQADTRVLQEAVSNVLDNALKYVLVRGTNSAEPSVSMVLRTCVSPLRGVEVVIEDNGAGVQEEDLSVLCEEGFRGARSADVPGTGLGLHITKQLVELLNGELLLTRGDDGCGLRAIIQMREADAVGGEAAVDGRKRKRRRGGVK